MKWGSTNAYLEDDNGEPMYDFSIIDRFFDAYMAAGIKPFVQLAVHQYSWVDLTPMGTNTVPIPSTFIETA